MYSFITNRALLFHTVWFEPTSAAKSILPITAGCISMIDYASPNQDEVVAIATALGHPIPSAEISGSFFILI